MGIFTNLLFQSYQQKINTSYHILIRSAVVLAIRIISKLIKAQNILEGILLRECNLFKREIDVFYQTTQWRICYHGILLKGPKARLFKDLHFPS